MAQKAERDLAKERYWREVLLDWRASGLSGREFCRQKNLIFTTFANWKRRIPKRDAELQSVHNTAAVRAESTTTREVTAARLGGRAGIDPGACFAPVHLVDSWHGGQLEAPPAKGIALEIALPSGVMLRATAGCPIKLLSSVISLLEVH